MKGLYFLLFVILCHADIVGMYMTAPLLTNQYISPEDMCSGKLCRFRVKQVMRKCKLYEHKLKQLDRIERRLNREAERDMLDLSSLQNTHDHRVLQHKLRKEQKTLRKVRLTRVKLMNLMRRVLSDLSYSQQARVIRYIGLEHRIDPSYENLTKNNGLNHMKPKLI
ncbi:hypothetical protein EHI8A_067040 [Entamoeba histolytica HM-1:IMSS-B]|uniref:Uncharacterized protein n=8 Tax=Entamoeba TaxID=5758 RepID=C4LUL0_ENTH1|nr:hypothetical protein ENU1_170700 [Entamoeba nuttalli P19]XP_653491.1 hypothetical protein EHI_022970 [Entamoeba histolytica HM-1:IMSS]EMD43973.1 Hypothetical protein EHI5A_100740 [Entamoeba histolytica KU27]EMH76879.1 hypothetical protein EHI8A_067040 [Entamoeba histolytica HM-1:IMSS-B]EMS11267.1 hypothetical protein KM1_122590 [Entamoeba histolytica HM-3:IMSS]ENY62515.1 hypothetical protein EHI7A_063470 [Entamoeba histolytica HM-1:IMSS-A]GAT92307.1 hypothetical protein CL6EHI_022970 [Enta|eukprot:XP_008859368.1 hypothetical protein ENU1_170700 [Entamoeba nuttalli P19]